MLCTQDQRQACIDTKMAYFAKGSKVFHTWVGCANGQSIRADNLTCGTPRRAKECANCAYHENRGERRTGGP